MSARFPHELLCANDNMNCYSAGALKIADSAKFALDVSNYRLVPHEMINLVAILVP
jgi:hypothetical protein